MHTHAAGARDQKMAQFMNKNHQPEHQKRNNNIPDSRHATPLNHAIHRHTRSPVCGEYILHGNLGLIYKAVQNRLYQRRNL